MGVALRPVNIAVQIETLVRRIKQGSCILFLGPGLLRTKDNIPLSNAFAMSLAAELRKEKIDFDETQEQNMAYMIQNYILSINKKNETESLKIIDLRAKYVEFVRKAELDQSLYKKLTRIPFRLVINANYDNLFADLFAKSFPDVQIQFDWYDFSNQAPSAEKEKLDSPGQQNYVVYNLFGLCDDQSINSLILTEKEFVRFVCRIHQPNTTLPREITNYIDKNKYCLFLGFDFDQWYLKVVIGALWNANQSDSESEKEKPNTLALSLPPYSTGFFYEDAYKFYFVNEDLGNFSDTLLASIAGPEPDKKDQPVLKEPPLILFISDINSKEDNGYRKQISEQLQILINSGDAALWSEDIPIGEARKKELDQKILQADIVIALVSIDFYNKSKLDLIKRIESENTKKHLVKLAVLLRPCVERFQDQFPGFTWIPGKRDINKPIDAISLASNMEQEKKIAEIADKVMQYVENFRK